MAIESRSPEQTIPETGFFLSVGSAVVKNNPQFLIAPKSCKIQRKTAYSRRNKLFSGAAGRIRTADLILTNRNLKLLIIISVRLWPFLFRFICFPTLFKSTVSAYSTQVCGCLCGQSPCGRGDSAFTSF